MGESEITDRSADDAAVVDGVAAALVLIVVVGIRRCAIPVRFVAEILRPLPVQPLGGVPAYVRGLSVIRGAPVPVVDVNLLIGDDGSEHAAGRLAVIDVGERRIALAVDAVLGMQRLDAHLIGRLPPLLHGVASDVVEAIGVADARLLVVLRAARLGPDEVWSVLAAGQEAP